MAGHYLLIDSWVTFLVSERVSKPSPMHGCLSHLRETFRGQDGVFSTSTATTQYKQQLALMRHVIMPNYIWTQTLRDIVSGLQGNRICCSHSLTRLAQEQQQNHLNFTFSFPQTDSKAFQNISATKQDQLMADFIVAVTTRERAVTGATHDDQARIQGRW